MKNLVLLMMLINTEIERKKASFNLPYEKDLLEYWGPINNGFADSFLTMSNSFIEYLLKNYPVRVIKGVFSSFVEMVQNIAEYNEEEFPDNVHQSFVRLRLEGDEVIINTANVVKQKDIQSLEDMFANLFSWSEEELLKYHKERLMSGGSLGLIMLRKLKGAKFEYQFSKDHTGNNWLSLELKIHYGSTEN